MLIENCHSSAVTALCSTLLNAFISSAKDGSANIWDIDTTNGGDIQLFHEFDTISSNGITNIYPFRCHLTNKELLAITTVEGINSIYILNDIHLKLLTILHTNYQSEIVDISGMNDGVVLSVSTLNGYIYLFDTVNFDPITFQQISEKPIIFAKYKCDNNDYLHIDSDGKFKLYPQSRPNTQCSSIRSKPLSTIYTNDNIPSLPPSSTESRFTINTPKPTKKKMKSTNPFSTTTISTSMLQQKAPPLFQQINNRERNIINPLKNESILQQMKSKENIDPQSAIYAQPKSSSISKFYQNQIEKIENAKFDINDENIIDSKLQQKQVTEIQKKLLEEQKKRNTDDMYGSLPSIESKRDLIEKKYTKRKEKRKVKQQLIIETNNKHTIQPSIKPFIKRSLEPERRASVDEEYIAKKRRKRRERLGLNMKKTMSISKKMTSWMTSSFNQRL